MSAGDDMELARLAAAGDRTAFAMLVGRSYGAIHAFAWRIVGDRSGAEDIAQETMVKIAQSIAGFRGDSSFMTWARRIAYCAAVDHIRFRRKVVTLAPQDLDNLRDSPSDGAPQEVAAGDAELWRAVRALPDQQRDAILLVYGEDLSHAEAAAAMGISEKTISWHVHEGRKRLKRDLMMTEARA